MTQTKITDYFNITQQSTKKVYGLNDKTHSWHCISCGVDMGIHNPRQLCRKYYCDDPDPDSGFSNLSNNCK